MEANLSLAELGTLDDLLQIGTIKQQLPREQHGWINELGLYVQVTGEVELDLNALIASGVSHKQIRIEAGSRQISNVELVSDDGGLTYLKYKWIPGDWEALVRPTAAVATWIVNQGGVSDENQGDYWEAINHFRQTGDMTFSDN